MGKTTRTFPSLPCAVGIVRLARTSVTEEEAEVPRTVINRPTVLAHIRRGLRQVGGNVELAAPLVVLRQRQARQEDTATRLVTGVREDELAILNIRQLGLIDCDDRSYYPLTNRVEAHAHRIPSRIRRNTAHIPET